MLPYLRLELEIEAASRGPAPPFPAPLLRRVLGKALVDGFCPWGEPRCQAGAATEDPHDRCRLAGACPYGVLVAASLTPRPPFALYVPSNGSPRAPQQGAVTLEVTLYGPAWRLYAWVVAALARALARGLGKARTPFHVRRITRVHADGRRDHHAVGRAGAPAAGLPADLEPDLLGLSIEPLLAPQPVTVHLLSPARLLVDGRLVGGDESLPFAVLVARILDRLAGLYGPQASAILDPEVRTVVEGAAARVPLLADETRWVEVEDYSARKRSELLLGGKVGRLVYGPQAAPFVHLLRAGGILHVGKNPASGCGRIAVELAEPGAEPSSSAPSR